MPALVVVTPQSTDWGQIHDATVLEEHILWKPGGAVQHLECQTEAPEVVEPHLERIDVFYSCNQSSRGSCYFSLHIDWAV